jgi:N-acetylglucosaminyl-diphospho-decaprenol L-rhamnosyltransferase
MAICIVNYNTCDQLRSCLESVSGEDGKEIIVIDNCSSDGSQEMVQAEFPTVLLKELEYNIGYGAAADLGISLSTSPYILLLNSDTLLQSGALDRLSEYLDENPKAGIVGPRLINQNGSLQPSCFPMPSPLQIFFDVSHINELIHQIPFVKEQSFRTWNHSHNRSVPWVQGAALAIRKEAYQAVGGFDKAFFMYYEETDLCRRMSNAGWETHFSPVTEIIHIGGASTHQIPAKMELQYWASLALFYRKHFSRLQLVEMVLLIKCVAVLRLIRDSVLRILSNPVNRPRFTSNLFAWKHILFDQWYIA